MWKKHQNLQLLSQCGGMYNLSERIGPWDTLACCWDIKQAISPINMWSQVTEQVQRQDKDSEAHSSDVVIEWNGALAERSTLRSDVITSEFLEPYRKGDCGSHYNCLGCLTDTLCSWCEVGIVWLFGCANLPATMGL